MRGVECQSLVSPSLRYQRVVPVDPASVEEVLGDACVVAVSDDRNSVVRRDSNKLYLVTSSEGHIRVLTNSQDRHVLAVGERDALAGAVENTSSGTVCVKQRRVHNRGVVERGAGNTSLG